MSKLNGSILGRAIAIAAEAHKNQFRWNDEPYIFHCLRVMDKVEGAPKKAIAVLHDVLEDTSVTAGDMDRENIPMLVIQTVEVLTRCDYESYKEFINRIAGDEWASEIKIADIEDNMDIRGITSLSDSNWERIKKYHKAWSLLKRKLDLPIEFK